MDKIWRIALCGYHDGSIHIMYRVVYLGRHTIEVASWPNGREELVLNGTVIAYWDPTKSIDDMTVSEQFQELTGIYPYEWDAKYKSECWPEYSGVEWYFQNVCGAPVTKYNRPRR